MEEHEKNKKYQNKTQQKERVNLGLTGNKNQWTELCVYLGLKVLIGETGDLLQLLKCAVGLREGKGKVRWSEVAWVVEKVITKYPLEFLWVYSDVTTHYCGTQLCSKILTGTKNLNLHNSLN